MIRSQKIGILAAGALWLLSPMGAGLMIQNPSSVARADGGSSAAVAVGIEAGRRAWNAGKKLFSSHPFVQWQGKTIGIGLYYDKGQESRASYNFSRSPFAGSKGKRVKVEFLNVRAEDLRIVRATVLADKPGRPDRARSDSFGHGSVIKLGQGTSGDRGYYIARINFPGGRQAFCARNPNAAVKLTILD